MRFDALRTTATFAVVAACVALPAALAPPAEAAFPGTNGKIAFMSHRDANWEIYAMNSDGTGEQNLTTNPASDEQPAWSPDGQRIAFTSMRDGNQDVYVMNADGTGLQNLTTNPAHDLLPAWSPDGQRIAFASTRDGNQDLYVMNADGTGPAQRLTTSPASDSDPDWSPDGQRIAFMSTRDDNLNEIYVMNADGTGPAQRLTTSPLTDREPDWSPDGRKIAFTSHRGDAISRIYVMNADGSGVHDVTPVGAQPTWSPDGQKIAFQGREMEIYVVNADGSGEQRLTNTHPLVADANPDWQPVVDADGDALSDSWETEGIDVDGDGAVDLDLPAMGASPSHKDIFLEIDYMTGHALSQAAVDRVVAAFAAAPVDNPDGVPGITLHVDNGPASFMNPVDGTPWGGLSDSDALARQAVLGTSTNGVYDWSAVDAVKAANFEDARARVFHYVVSGNQYGSASNTSSGISRNADGAAFGDGASDLLVTLGGSGTIDEEAGTLMHELGHNLGLKHGGDDHGNYKPSYLSIMNYAFQMTGLLRSDLTTVLDYSRLPVSLDENALDEDVGFGFDPASEQGGFLTAILCPGEPRPPTGALTIVPLRAGPVDWDCDNLGEGVVAADVNGDSAHSSFAAFLDWPALVYGGGAIGDAGASAELPQTSELIEPQLAELRALEEALQGGTDTTAPVLTVPENPTLDATGPAGAVVSYAASASDDHDPSPTLACAPASGSVFAIGTTEVTCTATDDAGNSTSDAFTVRVRGAPEQIVRLIDKTLLFLDLRSLEAQLRARLEAAAEALLAKKKKSLACAGLGLYGTAVKIAPSRALTVAEKAELRADANRIRAVIGC
jgi:TolB protein